MCTLSTMEIILVHNSFKFSSHLYATIITLFFITLYLSRRWMYFLISILIFGSNWIKLRTKTILLLQLVLSDLIVCDFVMKC